MAPLSIAWGIQLEMIPFILAIRAYDAAEPVRSFFSALSRRASVPRGAIPSLPAEVVDEILAHLSVDLLEVARRGLIKEMGPCDCSNGNEAKRHQCGMMVTCTSWYECCPEYYYESDGWEKHLERLNHFEERLHTEWIPRIEALLATFSLEIVLGPRMCRARGVANFGSCLDIIVGYIPAKLSFVNFPTGDDVDDFPDDPTFKHRRLRHVIPGGLELSDEQRTNIKRFVRALGLESSAARRVRMSKKTKVTLAKAEALETGKMPAAHQATPNDLVWDGRTPEKPKPKAPSWYDESTEIGGGNVGTGTSYLEPKLLVVHAANRAGSAASSTDSDSVSSS